MVNLEYANAYTEVYEILKCIHKSDYDKIPKNIVELISNNRNLEYKFNYDMDKTLEEQNVSKKAKTIIAILFRDYWSTYEQKEKILKKEKHDRQKVEEEKREKFKTDKIFKKNKENTIVENQDLPVKIKKENFFKKIINFIKGLFNENN